ncbi:uncharacterized protein [Narcine bancroftii]|uniref:uncharacterized protein n=1 Tax=Narcine bancroftii TaxID=1343680 RepID=UPI003831EFC7
MCSRPCRAKDAGQRTPPSEDECDTEYYHNQDAEYYQNRGHAMLASLGLNQASPHNLSDATVSIKINGSKENCLMDSGSTKSFIDRGLVECLVLNMYPSDHQILLESSRHIAKGKHFCRVTLEIQGTVYEEFKLLVLPRLCAPVLLGLDFQCQLKSIMIVHNGPLPPLLLKNRPHRSLTALNIEPPPLFTHLIPNCTPVATKSKRYRPRLRDFIRAEARRLLQEGIIEKSSSPWSVQVVVVKSGKKQRMVVYYSQTINKFTQLDAYPLSCIANMVNSIAQYKVFSTIDLKAAYHQLPIRESDHIYTAFEADGRLY